MSYRLARNQLMLTLLPFITTFLELISILESVISRSHPYVLDFQNTDDLDLMLKEASHFCTDVPGKMAAFKNGGIELRNMWY